MVEDCLDVQSRHHRCLERDARKGTARHHGRDLGGGTSRGVSKET
jgi:hypothetical protein